VNDQTIRPVGRESDKGLALLQSLDEKQRQQAVLSYRVADLVLGPGQDGKKIAPEGLKASAINEKQRTMLLNLIAEWAGIINETAASARMSQLKAELDHTWFAWSGPTTFPPGANITAYYRIQGPHLVIEYAPQHDEPANHVHMIYRDPQTITDGSLLAMKTKLAIIVAAYSVDVVVDSVAQRGEWIAIVLITTSIAWWLARRIHVDRLGSDQPSDVAPEGL
jgi:Protein of unknown function (DUF3500)